MDIIQIFVIITALLATNLLGTVVWFCGKKNCLLDIFYNILLIFNFFLLIVNYNIDIYL